MRSRILFAFLFLPVALLAQVSIPWSDVDKTSSSLADLSTRSAGDLSSGTLDNARLDSDLTSWAAITRASGFDAFAATPSGANLASLLTTALPASKGGTGLTALSANIVTFLGAADYAAMRTQLSLVPGTDVQAYDADLLSWAGVTRASGFDTFTATPSSANLAALLTDETGTGAAVFANSPDLTGTPTAPTADAGTNTTQIATTSFVRTAVDAATQALDVKASVRAISTTNLTLSGEQTVDGVALVAGDRILVAGQSTGAQNGIYVVAAGAWSRATDADTSADVTTGLFTFVSEGTTNASNGYVLTTPEPIVLGTTALTFTQFSGAGQIIAGTGLTKSGNTLSTSAIPNASLANSAITIAGTSTALGASISLDTITGLSTAGLVKRTGSNALAIAAAGTDYAPATSGSAILYGNGSGGFSSVTVGGNLSFAAGTLNLSATYAGQNTIATVGALDAGSITSNFGSINIGTDSLTAGAISGTTGTFSDVLNATNVTVSGGTFTPTAGTTTLYRANTTTSRLVAYGPDASTTGILTLGAMSSNASSGSNAVITINASGGNGPWGQTTPAAGSFTTLSASGAASFTGSSFAVRATGFPASGAGIEMAYNSGTGVSELISYDRTGAAYKKFIYTASEHRFNVSATDRVVVDGTGLAVTGGISATENSSISGGKYLSFGSSGAAAPTFTTRSAGTKLILYDQISGSALPFSLGIEPGALWLAAGTATDAIKIYAGTTLSGTVAASSVSFPGAYSNTTASAANVFVASDGTLQRSTSSLRYKTDVQDYTRGLADVLKLRPVSYKGINDGDKVFAGFIAEEVAEAGLEEFVVRDSKGRPDALHYPQMVALAFAAIKEQDAEIKSLRARVAALEAK
jgi:hypothetical protein